MADSLNKHESKYFNTARLMNDALILLLENKDYAYITVKELCKKAGVNRSTFYLHYETMDDLLRETLDYTTERFQSGFSGTHDGSNPAEPLDDLMLITPRYLYPYLDFVRENRRLYLAAIARKDVFGADEYSKRALEQTIFPILKKLKVDPDEQKYMLAYYINGVHAVILEWARNGCRQDNEFIYKLLIKFIFNGEDPEA